MEPSRDTAGRRRRELLAQARQLDELYGDDESRIVYQYADDGWTVRRVERIEDQWREGELMRSCLRKVRRLDPNVYSLRDEFNLPHVTPAVYRVGPHDDLSEIPIGEEIRANPLLRRCSCTFLKAHNLLLLIDSTRPLKPERREQLAEFAEHADLDHVQPFPTDTGNRLRCILPFLNLDHHYLETAEHLIARNHPAAA